MRTHSKLPKDPIPRLPTAFLRIILYNPHSQVRRARRPDHDPTEVRLGPDCLVEAPLVIVGVWFEGPAFTVAPDEGVLEAVVDDDYDVEVAEGFG